MLYHAFPRSWVVTILLVNSGFLRKIRKTRTTGPVQMHTAGGPVFDYTAVMPEKAFTISFM